MLSVSSRIAPWRASVVRRVVCLVVVFACVARLSAAYDGLVVFGDSLSDMGNRYVHSGKPNLKWRRNWVSMLADPSMMNVPDFKPSGTSSYYGGTNYAVGGAGTAYTAELTLGRNKGTDLTTQISGRYLNPAFNTDGVRKDALHIVRIGTNDLVAALVSPKQILAGWSNLEEAGVGVARSVEEQIQALASAGVRHVLWGNLTDTAKIPSVVAHVSRIAGPAAPGVLEALKRATLAHNREMDEAIKRLEAANPELRIIRFDLYSYFEDLAADPGKYGLDDVTTGANNPRHLFLADGLHPTSTGHRLLAEQAWKVIRETAGATVAGATKP